MVLAFQRVDTIIACPQVHVDSNMLSGESRDVETLEPHAPAVYGVYLPAQGNGMLAFFKPLADC